MGGMTQVNPLAAITAGNQAAQAEFQTRGMQAQQALGNILQMSTDADGNVDYQKAHTLAAQAGPVVQMGMAKFAGENAALRGAQIQQAGQLHSFIGNLAVSGVQDPSDANWDNIRKQAVNAGMPAGGLAEIDRIRALPADQRSAPALQHVVSNLEALQKLHMSTGGVPTAWSQGGATQGGTYHPITGAIQPAGPALPTTLSAAQLDAPVEISDPRKTLPDGSPNPDYGNKKTFTYREQLEMNGATVLPNGQVIYPRGQGGGLGNGRYPTLPPALGGPGNSTAPPPAAATPPTSAPVATPNPAAPPVPAASPPSRSPYDNRPVTTVSPAEQEQQKAAGGKFDAEATAGTQAQGQQAILANMLGDTKQFMPGPYASSVAALRARLAPVFGVNEQALAAHDSFEKLAAQLALQQAGSVGAGSDSRFGVTQTANPHGGTSPASIDLIIRQLQGNSDYISARQHLAQQWPAKSDYNGFVNSVRALDPRVFQYERMSAAQRKDWFNAMDSKDQQTFMRAHGWAEDKQLIPSR
jgi:hypothetical protein